ncbi:hypothetical protein [Marmoricola sp. URHB0036]|uniref:hypothetical protein n=1 Tax=Marmoricola sp. URHB0036 TaxID=1298863 RepID=UPI0003FD3CCC|nr:hypothetical protein [Marmoricola sp. URHB0036]
MQLPILARLIASASAVALLLTGVGSAAHGADPTYPTGTFTVDRTSTYALAPDGDVLGSEPVVVTRHEIIDDTTAPDDIQVVLDPNDGASGSFLWSAPYCPGDTCSLGFSRVGTFTPHALLTDQDGHTSIVGLPQVTVIRDLTAPVVRLTKPRPRLRHRISAWRVLHGTVSDRQIGVWSVHAGLTQKRHGRWYCYSDYDHRWHKGLRSEAATWRGAGDYLETELVGANGWRTPRIPGLTRGRLVVRITADDRTNNFTPMRVVHRGRLTRR